MSYEKLEQNNKSRLEITTKGLGIKTPDKYLKKSEFEIRFLYDDKSNDQHRLEVRILVDGKENILIIPQPNSKLTIEIKNAVPIEQNLEKDNKLKGNLINLNKLHGKVLKDLPDSMDLINVKIKAKEVMPYTVEKNTFDCYTEKITGKSKLASYSRRFTRFIGTDFDLDDDAEIKLKIDSPKESFTIKPRGKDVSIILDNDCLSSKGDGFSDFHLYYDVLDGGDTRVKLKPVSPRKGVEPLDLMMACNAIEGGDGGS